MEAKGRRWNVRVEKEFHCFLSFSDGQLYAGVYVDFMGTDSAIFRTLGTKTAMRTDQYNSRWLNGESPPALAVQLVMTSCVTVRYPNEPPREMKRCHVFARVYNPSPSDKQEMLQSL